MVSMVALGSCVEFVIVLEIVAVRLSWRSLNLVLQKTVRWRAVNARQVVEEVGGCGNGSWIKLGGCATC